MLYWTRLVFRKQNSKTALSYGKKINDWWKAFQKPGEWMIKVLKSHGVVLTNGKMNKKLMILLMSLIHANAGTDFSSPEVNAAE